MEKRFYSVDAEGKILGRLATQIANILRGKNKVDFAPNVDSGDYVIVINAAKIKVSGKKKENKIYRHYSGYPGGLKEKNFATLLAKKPEQIILSAVRGMLPKNKLARQIIKKLKVYPGKEHKHSAQKPEELKEIKSL